jgi:hypothetical protein
LELGDFGLEGVPEVSADDIQEIVETLGADFPAGTDVGDALPGAEAGPAAAPAHRVAPAPDRPVATPAVTVTVAVAAKEEPAGDDVVSLEEIAITPPPPHAEALAPLLSGSFSMPEEPPPPPAPVSPPLVVPAPTRVRDAGVVEAKEETTASYPVPPPPPASPAFAVPPRPVPPAAQTAAPAPPPPPPAPSPPVEAAATWGSTPTFVSGEHRVVFHTVAGQVLRGTLSDADLVGTELPLTLPTGETEHVESARLKAVFFMRAPGEAATASLGTKVRVTFADGRQIAGMSPDYAPGAAGFFVIPLESRTNTGRIWVFRDAVRQISLG